MSYVFLDLDFYLIVLPIMVLRATFAFEIVINNQKYSFNMLHFRVVRLAFLFLCCSLAHGYAKDVIVSSPNGSITVTVGVKDNKPYYWVKYLGKTLICPSHLGFQLDSGWLGENVRMVGHSYDTKDETWTQPWGEEREVRNHYNELTVSFQEKPLPVQRGSATLSSTSATSSSVIKRRSSCSVSKPGRFRYAARKASIS